MAEIDQNLLNQIFQQIGTTAQSISQLNHDYTALTQKHAALEQDVAWLVRFFWVVMTASVGSFITSLWYLIVHYKDKKNGKHK